MGEVGAVDDHQRVGLCGHYGRRSRPDAREERGQPGQHRKNAHDRDVGDRKQALDAFGLHRFAADAGESDVARPRLTERPHQLEAELIARVLAGETRATRNGLPGWRRISESGDEQAGGVGVAGAALALGDKHVARGDGHAAPSAP